MVDRKGWIQEGQYAYQQDYKYISLVITRAMPGTPASTLYEINVQ